jgi:hypothetical protein
MAVGRISGPLLKDNLLRNGVNLAFETSLLYLDVTNSRVGINTITPTNELQVNGTTRTTNLYVSTQAQIGTVGSQFTITGNTISSDNATINLLPQGVNPVVYQGTISVGNININTNTISTTGTNTNLEISPTGTGIVEINSNATVYGNLHATGSITADGNITLGDASTDTVTFSADINSDIIPSANNTYNLGSPSNYWNNLYVNSQLISTITTNDLTANGILTVHGASSIGGTTVIGLSSANTISIISSFISDLIPNATNTYSLGTNNAFWNTAYISTFTTAGLSITGNSITSTVTNTDLQLSANGNGNIYISSNNLQVDNNADVSGVLTVTGTTNLTSASIVGTVTQTGNYTQTGDFNQTGNFETSGTATVTGNVVVSGEFSVPNITISNNTITTNTGNLDLTLTANGSGSVVFQGIKVTNNNIQSVGTNSDLLLSPNGSGNVVINNTQSFVIPVGTVSERPSLASNGMIRYNSEYNQFEGYGTGYWTRLGGVRSVDGNTYITPELTPGAGDNIIRFYANNVNSVYIDSTKLYTNSFQTSGISISNNTISTKVTDTDLNLTTAGSGGVVIGNLKFTSNSITNIVSGSVTTFNETGDGYVKISGTNGVVIPVGSTEPTVAELGMIRYNSSLQYVEMYTGGAGTGWQNVAGSAAGVTQGDATDLSIVYAVLFG